MSEPPPSRLSSSHKHKSLLERLSSFIFREPENREDLLQALHDAHDRDLLDADALSMIEGVLQVSERRARDLMIPRSQMDVIDISEPPESWIPFIISTAHSRFPVIEGSRDQVIGILAGQGSAALLRRSPISICAPACARRFLSRRASRSTCCSGISVLIATTWPSWSTNTVALPG